VLPRHSQPLHLLLQHPRLCCTQRLGQSAAAAAQDGEEFILTAVLITVSALGQRGLKNFPVPNLEPLEVGNSFHS